MLIHSGAELESYSRSEEDRLEALISGIAASGAKVAAHLPPALFMTRTRMWACACACWCLLSQNCLQNIPLAMELSIRCLNFRFWQYANPKPIPLGGANGKPRAAQVVVAGSAIGEMAMHFIEQAGLMAVRIPSKFDLRRFCRCAQPHGQHCRPGELVLSHWCVQGFQQLPVWCKGYNIL